MSTVLNVPEWRIPDKLTEYIAAITLGNPLFVREALVQLEREKHIGTLTFRKDARERGGLRIRRSQ